VQKKLVLITLFCILLTSVNANSADQKPAEFINNIFNEIVPKPDVLWLTKQDKIDVAEILQHKFNRLRIRYWQKSTKDKTETLWILDEIGKEKPITIGVHIQNKQIVQLKVLTYRESRGGEVEHSFFTDQFKLARLVGENKLDRHIDGITGATMSVRALTKVARLALWLDQKVTVNAK